MGTVTAKQTTISGITYTTNKMDAARFLYIAPRVTLLFGEQLVNIFMAAVNMAAGAEGDEEKIAQAVGGLASDPKVLGKLLVGAAKNAADPNGVFGGDGLNAICRDLFQGMTCTQYRMGDMLVEGGPLLAKGAYEEHFKNHPMEMVKLAMWVVSINFFGSTAESSSEE